MNHKKSNKKKVFRAVIMLLLLGVACYVGLVGWVVYSSNTLPTKEPTDVIIVLGAQVKPDGTLSEMLRRRLVTTRDEYFANPRLIITCGGQGPTEPMPEGIAMREWLIAQGVPADDILAETESYNTRENLLNAKAMMEELGLTRALVVTSDYHVGRAIDMSRRLGIEAWGLGSPTDAAYWPKNYTREAMSWIKYWLEELF
ncbi:MAG: YdcF family protein [Clostridia bacterium]|nr:YdcF family protein [Clostridia bacterium]